jgi:hypothetical protein
MSPSQRTTLGLLATASRTKSCAAISGYAAKKAPGIFATAAEVPAGVTHVEISERT